MDPITATIAVAQLINAGLNAFTQVSGKPGISPDVSAAIDAGVSILTKAQEVSGLIVKAHREGRELTKEELDAVVAGDDRAREALLAAIIGAGGSAKPDAPGT